MTELVDIGVIAENAPSSATCVALDFIAHATHSVESRTLYLNSKSRLIQQNEAPGIFVANNASSAWGIEMSSENHNVLISVVIDKLLPGLQRHFQFKVEIGANFRISKLNWAVGQISRNDCLFPLGPNGHGSVAWCMPRSWKQ